jgi:hypothetical protein
MPNELKISTITNHDRNNNSYFFNQGDWQAGAQQGVEARNLEDI